MEKVVETVRLEDLKDTLPWLSCNADMAEVCALTESLRKCVINGTLLPGNWPGVVVAKCPKTSFLYIQEGGERIRILKSLGVVQMQVTVVRFTDVSSKLCS